MNLLGRARSRAGWKSLNSWVFFCIAVPFICAALCPPLVADIQNQRVLKQSNPKSSSGSASSGLLVVLPIRAEVVRGKAVDIPVLVSPNKGSGLHVRVLQNPLHGTLDRMADRPEAAVVFRYTHDRDSQEAEDAFTFLISDNYSESGSRHTAHILVRNARAELTAFPSGPVDFGRIPVGSVSTNEVTLANNFGSTVSGTLHVSLPWKIQGESEITLPEGSSRHVGIIFQPGTEGEQSCLLTMDPMPVQFPDIRLTGCALPPFAYLGANPVVATMEKPDVALVLSNNFGKPLSVRLVRPPSELRTSGTVSLPPYGTGTITVSASQLDIPSEGSKKFLLMLAGDSFEQKVDLTVKGANADPALELLHGGEEATVKAGSPLQLEGVIRNSSHMERKVEIVLRDTAQPIPALARQTERIKAKGFVTFKMSWVSQGSGGRTLQLELRDRDRLVDTKSWIIWVSPTDVPSTISPTMGSLNEIAQATTAHAALPSAQPVARLATAKERESVVLDLRPILEPGVLFNHLVLRWRYYGTSEPRFAVETLKHRSVLTDRTGDQEPELWQRVTGVSPQFENGYWTARLAMPLPGRHEYRVYPAGTGEVFLATLTMEVSERMFWWPPLRAFLVILLLLGIIRMIRRRHRIMGRNAT